ncbi:hypothetical protein [Caballeronia novacaledonica]|uniref:Uncharacterized protein n=1 Tax=Caballeronia novacaledonica TaxID=1544861 RepID=A0AA37IFD6_9BURK|nr:hypothetical protein [Caballeronia novacaledonica]GJH28162.1 hypothetical protein CBA19CS42_26620 [Caballeronia novacaledonica]
MLKEIDVELHGRDAGSVVRLRELPAMVADRHARTALAAIDEDVSGGVIDLAMRCVQTVRKLGPRGLDLLMPFVKGDLLGADAEPIAPLNVRKHIRDWRNVQVLQDAALLLHAGFVVGRAGLDVPIKLQAQIALAGGSDIEIKFCAPTIAAAIDAGMCSYVEANTIVGTEAIYDMLEILNVRALREFADAQRAQR